VKEAAMNATDIRVDEVITLFSEYARRIDSRDGEGWSTLFALDGALSLATRSIVGRSALAEFALRSPVGVHVPGLPSIETAADGSVVVISSWLFLNSGNGQILAGSYVDTLSRDGDAVRFVERRVEQRASLSTVVPPAVA